MDDDDVASVDVAFKLPLLLPSTSSTPPARRTAAPGRSGCAVGTASRTWPVQSSPSADVHPVGWPSLSGMGAMGAQRRG